MEQPANPNVRKILDTTVRIGRSALNNWLRGCGFTYKKPRTHWSRSGRRS